MDEWIYTLKNGKLPEDYKAKGLKEAEEVLNLINMSDRERVEYERFMENKRLQASVIGSTIKRAEEAETKAARAEAERQQAEAERQQAEVDKQQALERGLKSMLEAGVDETLARKQLGL